MQQISVAFLSVSVFTCLQLAGSLPVATKKCPNLLWNKTAITNPRSAENAAFPCVCPNTEETAAAPKIESCPEGWFHRDLSCFWFSNTSATAPDAVGDCENKKSALFVANDKEELRNITGKTMGLRWIGITKENKERAAEWQTFGGMPIKDLNWLITPTDEKELGNGWSDSARCVANYNPFEGATVGFYNYFYPCDWKFEYICERNATLFTNNCEQNYFVNPAPFQ